MPRIGELSLSGDVRIDGDLDFVGEQSITTTTAADLNIVPGAGGITVIGDAGTTSHTLNANDDLFVTGRLEVDGAAYFDTSVVITTLSGSQAMVVTVGTTPLSRIVPYTDDGIHLSIESTDGAGNNNIIITSDGNRAKNHDHNPGSTNPTLFIHSATNPDTQNDEWISFTHDQTNGVIDVGSGSIKFNDAVILQGNSYTAGDPGCTGYVSINVAGTTYKFNVST